MFWKCQDLPQNWKFETFWEKLRKSDTCLLKICYTHSNTSKEEWEAVKALADVRTIAIKNAGKGLCVVLLDRMVYALKAEKQVNDTGIYYW